MRSNSADVIWPLSRYRRHHPHRRFVDAPVALTCQQNHWRAAAVRERFAEQVQAIERAEVVVHQTHVEVSAGHRREGSIVGRDIG